MGEVEGDDDGDGGRWMVRGKKGIVEVPVGMRSSFVSFERIWTGVAGLGGGDEGESGGASRRVGLLRGGKKV